MHRVFAFGTLKKGFPLHDEGLDGARCLGRYRTVDPHPMMVAGPQFGPMMLDEPGTGLQVEGELYEVDGERLKVVDRLESCGKPGHGRTLLPVEPVAGGPAVPAIVYVKAPDIAQPRHTGFLSDYQDRRYRRQET